ncbi:hypothetical protein B566_EDAN010424 [Ephemera danica]|nr:hypothetical protein B566_EDAN010424 [Ephemera danica]
MRYLLLLMFLGTALAYKSYRGYQVYTSRPVSRDEMRQVYKMSKDPSFDFWSTPYVGRPLRVMVAPENVAHLVNTLNALGLQPELQIPDVGEMLVREKVVKVKRGKFEMRELNFSRYMEYDEERFWRKTRRLNPGSNCIGTDPNRNFDFLWNGDNNTDTCSETFPGSMPFSEPECAGINSYLIQNVSNTFLYIAMHSYGQLILYPWGHTTEPAPNAAALSNPGFDPPPSEIQPTVVETVAGINAMIDYILMLVEFKSRLKMTLLRFALFFAVIFTCQAYKSYSGYQIWQTAPLTEKSAEEIKKLYERPKFEVWDTPKSGARVRIMAAPENVHELFYMLESQELKPELLVEDVQTILDQERVQINSWRGISIEGRVSFDRFMNLEEIDAYLDTVVKTYPKMASLEVIGQSFEGRPMRVLKITKGDKSNNLTRPAVFIEAAIHAREWLAPPVALYVVQQLTTAETSMLDLADWYILPVANPDGYVYSWNEDRFWRHNRNLNTHETCKGVDLNRNFDVHWENGNANPCYYFYKGMKANSEPETKAISDFLLKHKTDLKLFLDLHSYGQFMLHPYGFTNNKVTPESVISLATEAAKSIENIRDPAYGTSQDFVTQAIGLPFSYTIELPGGGEGGANGFEIAASEILPVVRETWEGIKTLTKSIRHKKRGDRCDRSTIMKLSCLLLCVALLGVVLARDSFHGYQVLRTEPLTHETYVHAKHLEALPHLNFASSPRVGRHVDIMTSQEHVQDLRKRLHEAGVQHATLVHNMATVVEAERAQNEQIKKMETKSERAVTFDRYMTYDEIRAYLDEVAAANPQIATVEIVATSYEGRDVAALRISNGPGKKMVWIDCGIHAREWMSPPVCLKTIEEVIADSAMQDLVDWYILPVGNPDGYVYTWDVSRFWRKTRSPNAGSSCVGTDPNRNFDYMWNYNTNNNPCSETYPGTRAFSEAECDGIGAKVREFGIPATALLYLTIHSYGQVFYYPYGTQAAPAPNAGEMQTCGDIGAAAIEAVRGTAYQVYSESTPSNFIYGAMDDYAYDVGKMRYSYTVELPAGGSGFDPPPSDIIPVTTETWAGIKAMVEHVY